jgi:hypothetical protein
MYNPILLNNFNVYISIKLLSFSEKISRKVSKKTVFL